MVDLSLTKTLFLKKYYLQSLLDAMERKCPQLDLYDLAIVIDALVRNLEASGQQYQVFYETAIKYIEDRKKDTSFTKSISKFRFHQDIQLTESNVVFYSLILSIFESTFPYQRKKSEAVRERLEDYKFSLAERRVFENLLNSLINEGAQASAITEEE